MFTGIITDIGTIIVSNEAGTLHLRISCGYDSNGIKIGESIACNGVCLTVVDKGYAENHWFDVELSTETIQTTAPDHWRIGSKLNLERALKMGDDLSGHLVSGHVDGVATLTHIAKEGDSHRLTFEVPAPLHRFIAQKGSVTLNGVSLTVNGVAGQVFDVMIIPHTWAHTNFKYIQLGNKVHLEIDLLARYMARLIDTK